MNKPKYIHVKTKGSKNLKSNIGKQKHKPTCIEDYEKLPFHIHMNPKKWWFEHRNRTEITFWYSGRNYLKTKIGQNFDDIYSDMIKKTKPKYRHLLDQYLEWVIKKPTYYIKEIPYCTQCGYFSKGMLYEKFYINKEGILEYHETKEDLELYAQNKYRQNKLKRILYENLFDDTNEFDSVELVLADF